MDTKKPKHTKPRPAKYDPKVSIDGTFADVIKMSVNYTPPTKEKPAKKVPKKKK